MKDYVQGRKLVEAKAQIAPEALADDATPLKELLLFAKITGEGVRSHRTDVRFK